jgi:hypothetical protein
VCRYGYEEAAHTIQELYLSGRQLDAMSAVPDSLVDEVALCGPRERIQERLARWQTVPVQTLNLVVDDLDSLRTMAELVL